MSWQVFNKVVEISLRCLLQLTEPATHFSLLRDDDTACVSTHRTEFVIMGYSIRTLDWRCTLWMWWDAVALTGNFSAPPAAQELYLHNNDTENNFDAFENNNVCDSEPEVMRQCMDMARDHWDKNMSARHAFPV